MGIILFMFAVITLILNEVKSQQIIFRDISNNQGIINIGTQVIADSDNDKPVVRGRPFLYHLFKNIVLR